MDNQIIFPSMDFKSNQKTTTAIGSQKTHDTVISSSTIHYHVSNCNY